MSAVCIVAGLVDFGRAVGSEASSSLPTPATDCHHAALPAGPEDEHSMSDKPIDSRLLVCALGIESWVRRLSYRADHGDQEAERAIDKLREAFETAGRLCEGAGAKLSADEFESVYHGLRTLERAAFGREDYPREVLRNIAEMTTQRCRRLGIDPPDTSFLDDEPSKGS